MSVEQAAKTLGTARAPAERPHATGFTLGDGAPAITRRPNGRVVADRALAEVIASLKDDPRLTWDLKQARVLELVNERVGGGVAEQDLTDLSKRFPELVPTTVDLRCIAIRRVCEVMASIYARGDVETAVEMVEVLRAEHGISLKNANTIRSFRTQEPDLVPRFLEGTTAKYEQALKALRDAIAAAPERSYAQVFRDLGLSASRGGVMMLELRKRWPDAVPDARQRELWTDQELSVLKQVLDDAPLGATLPSLSSMLRAQAPALFDRHPLENSGVLAQTLRRQFGIDDWNAYKERQYATVFADLVARSPPETTLREIVEQIREDEPSAYSYISVQRLLKKWVSDPKAFPEIAALKGADGKFPWQLVRPSYTPALARHVAEVMTQHPGKSAQDYVKLLRSDPEFARRNPTFGRTHLGTLISLYPTVLPRLAAPMGPPGAPRALAARRELRALAERAATVANGVEPREGLTVAALARMLDEPRERVGRAIRANPALFPWYQQDAPSVELTLELALRVAVAMAEAPMGEDLRHVLERLNASPEIASLGTPLRDDVIWQLRRRYPELIPDWRTREQVFRAKVIRDAVMVAPKGTPFDVTLKAVRSMHPALFQSSWASARFVERLLQGNPERFPFLEPLRGSKGLELSGRGGKPPPADESDLELANRLSRVEQLPDRLPVLELIAARSDPQTFKGFDFLCVQHLLAAQSVMFERLGDMGMRQSGATIVGVPYSASADVTDVLRDRGWDVRRPPLDMGAMENAVRAAMKERIAAAKENGNTIIAIDDGGFVAQLLANDPELKAHASLFRIVEQTRRGITVADSVELRAPVVNVAQSWGKYVEGPMIGDSLREKALHRLARIGITSLVGKEVGVVGFGTIGAPWADYLRAQGAKVTVLDVDPGAIAAAKERGFAVASDRQQFFSNQDIIFGGTGVRSITADDLKHLRDGCVLGSGSSKLVEIDVQALNESGPPRVVEEESHPPTVEYELPSGKKVTLLAQGFPLNFDGSSEIVPNEKIQLTMALLMMGAIQASGVNAATVQRLDPALQLEVLEYFGREQVASEKEIAAALREAQAALKRLVPETHRRPPAA